MVGLGGADYGRSDDGLIQQPRESNLGGWKVALASNLVHAIDYGFVEFREDGFAGGRGRWALTPDFVSDDYLVASCEIADRAA